MTAALDTHSYACTATSHNPQLQTTLRTPGRDRRLRGVRCAALQRAAARRNPATAAGVDVALTYWLLFALATVTGPTESPPPAVAEAVYFAAGLCWWWMPAWLFELARLGLLVWAWHGGGAEKIAGMLRPPPARAPAVVNSDRPIPPPAGTKAAAGGDAGPEAPASVLAKGLMEVGTALFKGWVEHPMTCEKQAAFLSRSSELVLVPVAVLADGCRSWCPRRSTS